MPLLDDWASKLAGASLGCGRSHENRLYRKRRSRVGCEAAVRTTRFPIVEHRRTSLPSPFAPRCGIARGWLGTRTMALLA